MKIPKYIDEIMNRASYEYDLYKSHENYAAGYTLRICKKTPYTKVETLKAECVRLVKWANKNGGEGTAYILGVPIKTHYCKQSAVVTIFDPVMQQLEKYIESPRVARTVISASGKPITDKCSLLYFSR